MVTVTLGPGEDAAAAVGKVVDAAGDDTTLQAQVRLVTGGLRPALYLPAALAKKAGLTPDGDDVGVHPTGSAQASELMGVEPGAGAVDADATQMHRRPPASAPSAAAAAAGADAEAATEPAGGKAGKTRTRRAGGN